jgi:hypothetical protein
MGILDSEPRTSAQIADATVKDFDSAPPPSELEEAERVNRSSFPVDEFVGTERFQVVRRLGQGAAGTVYLVHDRERNARRALKTVRHRSPHTILMLKNEFREVEALRHPNLAHLDCSNLRLYCQVSRVRADAFMRERGVASPALFARVFVPGVPQANAEAESSVAS